MCPLIHNCAVYKIILLYQNKIIRFSKQWKRSLGSTILYHIEDAKNSQTKYKMPVIINLMLEFTMPQNIFGKK